MNALTTAEMTRIKAAQAETFRDTCQIGTLTVTHGSVYETESYSYATAIACGFKAGGGKETADGSQTAINSASVRLPFGTTVTSKDRIKLVSRFGTALAAAVEYKILGAPETGPTAITLQLQAIPTTGSG
jgi:hypothetical protein